MNNQLKTKSAFHVIWGLLVTFTRPPESHEKARYPDAVSATMYVPEVGGEIRIFPAPAFTPSPGSPYLVDVGLYRSRDNYIYGQALPNEDAQLLPADTVPAGQQRHTLIFESSGGGFIARHPETGAIVRPAREWSDNAPPFEPGQEVRCVVVLGGTVWVAYPAEGVSEAAQQKFALSISGTEKTLDQLLWVPLGEKLVNIKKFFPGFDPWRTGLVELDAMAKKARVHNHPDRREAELHAIKRRDDASPVDIARAQARLEYSKQVSQVIGLAEGAAQEIIRLRGEGKLLGIEQQSLPNGDEDLTPPSSAPLLKGSGAPGKEPAASSRNKRAGDPKAAPAAKGKKPTAPKPSKQTTKPADAPLAAAETGEVTRNDLAPLTTSLGTALMAAGAGAGAERT